MTMLGMSWPAIAGLAALTLAGGWLLHRLSRPLPQATLISRIVVASYALRVLIAITLYAISYTGCRLMRPLQIGDGFWVFALDSRMYHLFGQRIADAWRIGIELPDPQLSFDYFAFVGAIYRLLGPVPLYPIVINCWLAAVNGVLAARLARRLGADRSAVIAATLVAWWPSSFIWSTQLLKDSLTATLMLSVLALILAQAHDWSRSSWATKALRFVLLAAASFWLGRFRFYLGIAMAIAVGLVYAAEAGRQAWDRRFGQAIAAALIAVAVGVPAVWARTVDMRSLLGPPHPEITHHRLAVEHMRRGEWAHAQSELSQAMKVNPVYYEGMLAYAEIFVAQRRIREAIEVYEQFLAMAPRARHAPVEAILVELYVLTAREEAALGHFADAGSMCANALAFKPNLVDVRILMTQMLALTYEFNAATAAVNDGLALPHTAAEGDELVLALKRAKSCHERFVAEQVLIGEQRGMVDPMNAGDAHGITAERCTPTAEMLGIEPEPTREPEPERTREAKLEPERTREPELEREPASPSPTVSTISSSPAPVTRFAARARRRTVVDQALVDEAAALHLAPAPASDTNADRAARVSQELGRSLGQIDDQVAQTAYEASAESLGARRSAFIAVGGHSLMDQDVNFSDPLSLLRYLPRALAIGLLAPFPNQWSDTSGTTGVMHLLSCTEMVMIYALLAFMLAGGVGLAIRGRGDGLLLILYAVAALVPIALVVANVGTLFRLRLQFLLPLLVVAAEPLAAALAWGRSRWRGKAPSIRWPATASPQPGGGRESIPASIKEPPADAA